MNARLLQSALDVANTQTLRRVHASHDHADRVDVSRAVAELAAAQALQSARGELLRQATHDFVQAERGVTLARARLKHAKRQTKPRRAPFAWIESGFFLAPLLAIGLGLLWARAQGWLP